MGKEKAGPLTPKAISNRIKAKGLQKLRWYCQMCQKQCRDEVHDYVKTCTLSSLITFEKKAPVNMVDSRVSIGPGLVINFIFNSNSMTVQTCYVSCKKLEPHRVELIEFVSVRW